jgi:hypothetical protein
MLKTSGFLRTALAILVLTIATQSAQAEKAGISTTPSQPTAPALSAIERLARMPERPPIADILDAVKRDEIDLGSKREISKSDFNWANADELAKIIALFEKAYPGLTYVFLGRDSAFLADAIEVFYLSNGQVGRVRRLKASGASVYNASVETLMLFLRQNGFMPTSHGLVRPYVIIDRTSYRENSQMRRLLEAGYTSLLAAGVDPKKAMRQFAGVHVGNDDVGNAPPGDLEHRFFSRLSLEESGRLAPDRILRISADGFIDRSFWQDSYGSFEISKSGRLAAQVGEPEPPSARKEVLGEILEAVAVVTSNKFHKMVGGYLNPVFEREFEFGDSAKISLPSELTGLESKAKAKKRLAALEFLSSYDGGVRTRYQMARSLRVSDPSLVEIKSNILRMLSRKTQYHDLGVSALIYLTSLDIVLGLSPKEEVQLGERAMSVFENAMDQLALMLSNSDANSDLPDLLALLDASLKGGRSEKWSAFREKLAARWQIELRSEVEGLEAPLEAQAGSDRPQISAFRKVMASLKRVAQAVIHPGDLVFVGGFNGMAIVALDAAGGFDQQWLSGGLSPATFFLLGANLFFQGTAIRMRLKMIRGQQDPVRGIDPKIHLQFSSLATSVGRYMEAMGVRTRPRNCSTVLSKIQ